MNFHIIDPNIYQPKQLERFSGIPEKDIIIITRHLNTFISSNDEGLVNFVDHIHNKFLFNKNINVFFIRHHFFRPRLRRGRKLCARSTFCDV